MGEPGRQTPVRRRPPRGSTAPRRTPARGTPAWLIACAGALALACAAPAAALAPQSGKLAINGETGSSNAGRSVALSSDGNTAIVGAPQDNGAIGAAWIYTRSGGVWTQGPKLTGTGETGKGQFGWSVALSANGETAIVGGNGDNGGKGAFWFFVREGGTWTQQGTKMSGSGAVGAAHQGEDVALSDHGNTALIGGPEDSGGVGAAWVFTRTGTTWIQQGEKLLASDETGVGEAGYSVALSNEGNTALLGGPGDNTSAGAAWVFSRSGTTWTQLGGKLTGSETAGTAEMGFSAALSADGGTALLGGPFDGAGKLGAAWVFTRSAGGFSEQGGKLTPSDPAGDSRFGWGVALSEHGDLGYIGGPLDGGEQTGALWQFARSGSSWAQQGTKVTGAEALGEAGFGTSVATFADGNTVFTGGPGDNSGLGAAWGFVNPPTATTVAASAIGNASATLGGVASDSGGSRAWFQLGPTTAYGTSTPVQLLGPAPAGTAVTAAVGALAPATTYHFRIVQESSGGTSYGADQTFTTHTLPVTITPAPITPALVRPVIAKLHETARRWRVGRSLARFSRSAPFGTTFTFVLNVPATVKLSFSHLVAGRRVGHNCVTKTRANAARRSCLRRVTAGTLQHAANAGLNTVFFSGRLSATHRLGAGSYTLTLTAKDAGGSSAPASLTFAVVR